MSPSGVGVPADPTAPIPHGQGRGGKAHRAEPSVFGVNQVAQLPAGGRATLGIGPQRENNPVGVGGPFHAVIPGLAGFPEPDHCECGMRNAECGMGATLRRADSPAPIPNPTLTDRRLATAPTCGMRSGECGMGATLRPSDSAAPIPNPTLTHRRLETAPTSDPLEETPSCGKLLLHARSSRARLQEGRSAWTSSSTSS